MICFARINTVTRGMGVRNGGYVAPQQHRRSAQIKSKRETISDCERFNENKLCMHFSPLHDGYYWLSWTIDIGGKGKQ